MRFFILCLPLLSLLLSGCSAGSAYFRARAGREKSPIASIRARFASKKMIALVFEVVPGKGGKREYAFQFDKSAAIDKALINRRFPVMERSTIQNVLEAQKLPESGSFKQEDIDRIAKQSQADIMIIGVVFSTPRPSMLNSEKLATSAILRAVDLKNFEVINSVQSESAGADVWRVLVPELLLLEEVN